MQLTSVRYWYKKIKPTYEYDIRRVDHFGSIAVFDKRSGRPAKGSSPENNSCAWMDGWMDG